MLAAASSEVEDANAFDDGDDENLAAIGIEAEIRNDLGIGDPSNSYEVSSNSDNTRNDREKVDEKRE